MARAFCMLGKEDKNTDRHSEYVILIAKLGERTSVLRYTCVHCLSLLMLNLAVHMLTTVTI